MGEMQPKFREQIGWPVFHNGHLVKKTDWGIVLKVGLLYA